MTIAWEVEIDGLTQAFETRGDAVFARLEAEMKNEVGNLLSYVKDNKLSGQVLNQRTANLKNSGFTEVEARNDQIVGSVVFGSGPTTIRNLVPYAKIHETGGTINIPAVEGKLMVFEVEGKKVFTTRRAAFTVTIPARPYLGPSLEETDAERMANFQAAVNEEMAR